MLIINDEQHKNGRTIYSFSFNFIKVEEDTNTRNWVDELEGGNPEKKQRKVITQQQAELLARVGESFDD